MEGLYDILVFLNLIVGVYLLICGALKKGWYIPQ